MNPHPTLIGLTGLAGVGKDTVAAQLTTQGFWCLGLADPIRTMIEALLQEVDADPEYTFERALKEAPIPGLGASYRHLAQTLGTEWGRNLIAPDFWLRIAAQKIKAIRTDRVQHSITGFTSAGICITDIRFNDEAQWLTAQGGVVWRIQRPGVQAVRNHISEAGVADEHISQTLHNTGTIADLQSAVAEALAAERWAAKNTGC
jgi:hypothetical protein